MEGDYEENPNEPGTTKQNDEKLEIFISTVQSPDGTSLTGTRKAWGTRGTGTPRPHRVTGSSTSRLTDP